MELNVAMIECTQSVFIPGDSCVPQLLSITQEIYESFNCSSKVYNKAVFLNVSKVFDKVWHERLLCLLFVLWHIEESFEIIKKLLKERQQRVFINRQTSSKQNVRFHVLQRRF